jgi:hypothetical protein
MGSMSVSVHVRDEPQAASPSSQQFPCKFDALEQADLCRKRPVR